MAAQGLSTNTFGEAKWVVASDATLGTHTTIAGAITSAASGDTIFIREGTYTENLTLKAGVNLASYPAVVTGGSSAASKVIISGNATMSTAGTVSITGIQLATNGAAVLTVSGTLASIVNLIECDIEASVTAISFSTSSASGAVTLTNCNININTTGVAIYSMTSAGTLNFNYCSVTNPGLTTTTSSNSAGNVFISWGNLQAPFATSSTGTLTTNYAIINTAPQNVTAVTTAGTGAFTDFNSYFQSGTASAISIGTGTTGLITNSIIKSSNTNAITGAGTLTYGYLSFTGSSSTINTTTLTPISSVRADAALVTISGDVNTSTVNLGTGAAAKTLNIGNTSSTTTVAVSTGTNTTTPVYTVATNSGTIISALGAGYINYPLTSAFLAQVTTTSGGVTGNATAYTIIYQTSKFDQKSNMTIGTGIFTAPVTGKYAFHSTVHVHALASTASQFVIQLVTTGSTFDMTINGGWAAAYQTGTDLCLSGSWLVPMTLNDTAKIVVTVSGMPGNTCTITNDGITIFGGHLVC